MDLLKILDDWYVDQIEGGKGDHAKPSDFDLRQLFMGVYVELEHTHDPMMAMEIAMDHLVEDPAYYDALKKVHKDEVDDFGLPG
jgi:sulfite reductase beta subunit-like hemoprotein